MSNKFRNVFAIIAAMAVFLPLHQGEAAQPTSSNNPGIRPITSSYTKQQCAKDGGSIDRKKGSVVCVLPSAAAKAVVKSKSNITNN